MDPSGTTDKPLHAVPGGERYENLRLPAVLGDQRVWFSIDRAMDASTPGNRSSISSSRSSCVR